MEDRNDIDLTTLCVDRWKHCDKCVIRNPSCDDCKRMWTAQEIDEYNIQRARIHERIDLTNEDDTDDEEVEAQELADADAELDDSDSDDDVKEEEPEEMEVQILGDDDQV